MPKYLLLKHYRGAPAPHRPVPPMDQWAPEDVEAHMAFLKHVSELLEENGEYVDAQALTPARTWVRYGGPDAAPVTTDGPLPETSDLVAGWYMIDVESHERAVELAAYVSRNSRLTERLHRLALPSYDPIEPSNSSLVSSDQWAARSHQPIGNRETL